MNWSGVTERPAIDGGPEWKSDPLEGVTEKSVDWTETKAPKGADVNDESDDNSKGA